MAQAKELNNKSLIIIFKNVEKIYYSSNVINYYKISIIFKVSDKGKENNKVIYYCPHCNYLTLREQLMNLHVNCKKHTSKLYLIIQEKQKNKPLEYMEFINNFIKHKINNKELQ